MSTKTCIKFLHYYNNIKLFDIKCCFKTMRYRILSAAAIATLAVVLCGCTANHYEGVLPRALYTNTLYDTYSYSQENNQNGDKLRYWRGGYTYPDFELDSKIAGSRQGSEVSFYLSAIRADLKPEWERLSQEHTYAPATIDKFETPAQVKYADYRREVLDTSRAIELERGYKALHGVSESYVRDHCELIADAMNDALPGLAKFIDPKYEDLYVYRQWPAYVTQQALFKYAKTQDIDKADSTYGLTEFPFVEKLRGTDKEPNVTLWYKHTSEQAYHGLGSWVPQGQVFFVQHYRCAPQDLKAARSEFFEYYPEALTLSNEIRARNGLPLERIEEPETSWFDLF